MKRMYVTPEVEKIEFQFRDQVVTASSSVCARYQVLSINVGEDAHNPYSPCKPTENDPLMVVDHYHFREWPDCVFNDNNNN